ncbi:hypothetical protein BDV59DRAFT_167960 [Aspergillus ambiguus]|uniref:uncharacterized protein n=1 Tax=Aspergillus ambiguus TaxID=176160 RepID=UPI003CCDBDFD
MTTIPRSRLLAIFIPPVVVGYGVHRGLQALETRYPAISTDDSTTSIALRTPRYPSSQRCGPVDHFTARIPLKVLQSTRQNGKTTQATRELTTAWAQAFLNTKPLRAEACALGLLSGAGFNPGDLGDTPSEFAPDPVSGAPRALAHGVFVVERPPAEHDPHGLMVRWEMPDQPRQFFQRVASWGYPWRLMSGGRHELMVSAPFEVDGEGPFVEVGFASAHDYEVIPSEGVNQKMIPEWTQRLHRGYARLLLHAAVRELGQ